jgi:membrane fusion protein, multidrug efflux system
MKIYLRILIAIVGAVAVLTALGTIKGLQINRMVAQGKALKPPPQTITSATVNHRKWETTFSAVGSLKAVQGVMVSAELSGKVSRIAFKPGKMVSAGQILLTQDTSEEKARLRAAQSGLKLARKNLDRVRLLHTEKVVSDSDYDQRRAEYDQAMAALDNIHAIIAKKTIRAPFSGRLGIRRINLGEVLEPGQAIVSLQSMDPIFVNFQLPQQELPKLKPGLVVRAITDAEETEAFEGVITAIDPDVDSMTRNIKIQATLNNSKERLRPGMYINVSVVLPEKRSVLTIPATAILHAPYSDSVFIVAKEGQESDGKPLKLRQQFVQLGEKRGDFVSVEKGLQPGQMIAGTGIFKLRNGMEVVVDNQLSPDFKLKPELENT